MNKKILIITLTIANAGAMVAHNGGGGGAFWGGLAVGTLATSAAMSNRGDRGPEYYDYKRDRDEAARARSERRSLEKELKAEQQRNRRIERDLERNKDSEKQIRLKADKEESTKKIQRLEDKLYVMG